VAVITNKDKKNYKKCELFIEVIITSQY